MGWTCCGGSGSSGRSACRGTRRPGPRPVISSGGCRWRASRPGRTGVIRAARPCPARGPVAVWGSAGVGGSELLGAAQGDADPGQQLITVVRKGSRALQPVPASADAFVWLRLYQAQMAGLVPPGQDQPLWWTLRRPFRPLAYHAAHRMFTRASAALGANWSLHDLRQTAAYRMARDPQMPLTDG